ncbi:MAG: SMP-30/gluconolactonase/LRE family protein [Spirochaetales bacterium]|uniref:SMP-30/gluconolactonase/LRE family protein n=1 Tax=Candidatus Thalassospirochaeta sargassi TaxID=3119039 RepID=A0AAJ1IDD8_9SPIO|nr:SMP-30/gluconolactonase/LRE family protein [Spirochaetales bacterium]
MNAEPVSSPGNILGEGPFSFSNKRLFWFDIFGSSVYSHDIAENRTRETGLDEFICCAGPTVLNEIIAAGSNGVAVYNEQFKPEKILFEPPFNTDELRFNDGKTGPDGAFWVGVMSHGGDQKTGMLLRITDRIECVIDHMLIPNGLGWSPDEKTMYVTDTGKGIIMQWSFNKDCGRITSERLFVDSALMDGVPDGLSVDSVGNVWSVFWGSSRVNGFRPSGEKFAEIRVDAENPTSCCFAGIDYSTLYITSATHSVDEPRVHDGALFKAATGTVGKPPYKFKF